MRERFLHMRLIKNSDHELIIRDRPSIFKSFFFVLWSSLFIGVPAFFIYSILSEIGITQLTCQRPEPQQVSCELTQSKFLGLVKGPQTNYKQVQTAKFNQSAGIDSDGNSTEDNWVSLMTADGEIPLFEDPLRFNGVKGEQAEMLALAAQINDSIQRGEPSFSIQRDLSTSRTQTLFPLSFSSLFILIGLAVIYLTIQSRQTRFDRNSCRVYWKRYSLLGIKSIEVSINDIHRITINEEKSEDSPTIYAVGVDIVEGDRIEIGKTPWIKQARRIKTKIQDFLDWKA